MKLATRLSLFFHLLLALVLAGSSATLYFLARSYLHRQADERLQAAVNLLIAAVERKPDGVEWEPAERILTFRTGPADDLVLWLVSDNQGRVVDRSGPAATATLLWEGINRLPRVEDSAAVLQRNGQCWLVMHRRVESHPLPDPASGSQRAVSEAPPAASEGRAPSDMKYPALTVTAGLSLRTVQSTLWSLAWALAGVSLAVWFLALTVGRAVCQRALRPVTRLAASARAMSATDVESRLPVPATADELDDLSRSFNGLLDRLHESFERQRRFTGDASHQLRTPLTALLGQIEVALRRERGPDEYRQVLVSVQKQGMHLRRIVESLLFLARADADARLPDLETVLLGDWLARHLASWSAHPRFGDIRIKRTVDTPLEVAVHPVLLGELLNILIENACKYSPAGAPITLRVERQGDNPCLSVEDRGSGIGAEELPHLGEPFFRSADARRRGIAGVGLGLAIARRLAEAQGGSLLIASQQGKGSRFTVSFPLNQQRRAFPNPLSSHTC